MNPLLAIAIGGTIIIQIILTMAVGGPTAMGIMETTAMVEVVDIIRRLILSLD